MEPSIVDEGIEAYKSGDKAEAVRLLSEAIRRDPKDENAWLWLGAALDDPIKRRQAFERVLQINPNNDKAKAALDRLGGAGTGTAGPRPTGSARPTGGTTGAATSESLKRAQQSAQKLASTAYSEGFKVPMKIEGAPERINGPYIMENGRTRAMQGFNFYMNRDVSGANVPSATVWDLVFTVGVGALALALVILVGRFIGFFVQLFRPGLGGFLMIFIAPILIIIAVGASVAAALYAAQFFLKQQYNTDASILQLGIPFAVVLLPMLLVQAVFEFFATAFGPALYFLNAFPPLIGLLLAFYMWFLLKDVYAKDYGSENDRNMYVAAIVVGVYIVVFGLIRIVFRV